MSKSKLHPGNSSVQCTAEVAIRLALEKELKKLLPSLNIKGLPRLDGFADGKQPICVEIWAHQGPAKSAQKAKVMQDMCKLLLCQCLLRRKCRKIFVVSDEGALSFLRNSWQRQFAEKFGIETRTVHIAEEIRQRIRRAQKQQYR